jgi:outer membrane protein insertion porin family
MNCSRRSIIHIFFILSVINSGCFNTRFLKSNEKLFVKNKIQFNTEEKKNKDKSQLHRELKELSQLQPNQKLFGLFKTRLWFYNVANRKKETKFRSWMKNKIGEPPTLLDSSSVAKSTIMMRNYLINKGFFYTKVDFETIYHKKLIPHKKNPYSKKASVNYIIDAGFRYKFDKINFDSDTINNEVNKLVKRKSTESLLKKGNPFDVNNLKQERERITTNLREHGYYLFNREMVYYDLDSNDVMKTMDVDVKISAPSDSSNHRKFYINNIYIYTDFTFERFNESGVNYDTLPRGFYYFIYENELRFKPYTILTCIYFKRGDVYKRSEVQKTIFNLTDLGVFKFINIKFEQLQKDTLNLLNCHIYLTPSKKQEMTSTFELNNNTYNLLGINVNLGYINKNLFRGAERFQFDITGGAETNFNTNPFFNTTDLSVSSSLLFNKFLVPFRIKGLAKSTRPKTRISLKFNYLTRINNFSIFSGNASYGYEWRKTNTRHFFNIASVSLVRAPVNRQSADFKELLVQSPSLRNSFSEQLIVGMNYTITWNYKLKTDTRNQLFTRLNNEMAGNFLNGVSALANIKNNQSRPYKIIGINYAQYYKAEVDFRHYFDINKLNRLASRFFLGIGIPYGNSQILPYVKQYFSGGSVSLRGWPVRTLGPGSFNYQNSPEYSNNRYPDQTGDIKLELNSEIRFNMIKFLKGAVFVDAGNIWLARIDTTRPGANFDVKRFYKEIALSTGFGIRVDLSYFILRFDIGTRLYDPTQDKGERWVVRKLNFHDEKWLRKFYTFNLALGYPF